MTREIENLLLRAEWENELHGAVSASTQARLVEAGYILDNEETHDHEESE